MPRRAVPVEPKPGRIRGVRRLQSNGPEVRKSEPRRLAAAVLHRPDEDDLPGTPIGGLQPVESLTMRRRRIPRPIEIPLPSRTAAGRSCRKHQDR